MVVHSNGSGRITERSQTFSFSGRESDTFELNCSVPQGSVIGPVEFIAYTEDVVDIFKRQCMSYHLYADDKLIYRADVINNAALTRQRLHDCVDDVASWCSSRRLQLNDAKTELEWFGSRANLAKLIGVDCSLSIGDTTIQPSSVVRYLGVLLDRELTLRQHVGKIASICYYHIRRLRKICRYAGRDIAKQLMFAFVLSRLDYCNGILAGLPKSTLSTLQHVQNAAARLVLNLRPREHITEALRQLHWLPIEQRIQFKLCLLMHNIQHGRCPNYIAQTVKATSTHSSRPGLRSASTASYTTPRLRTVMGERAFSCAGPKAWNSLPAYLHHIESTATFKRQLKTFFFNYIFRK